MDEQAQQPEAGPAGPAGGFPLDAVEIFADIRGVQNNRAYKLRHIFRTPMVDHWREYWRRTERSLEAGRGDKLRSVIDRSEAVEWLWLATISSVERYALQENWKSLIPYSHKAAAIDGIAQVYVADEEDGGDEAMPLTPLGVDEVTIVLEAARNGESYGSLRHTFATPSSEDEKEWSRLRSTTYMVTGGKRGSVREEYPDTNGFLLKLYDKLVRRVEGYSPNDPKVMDPLHKVIAAGALLGNFRTAA